MKNIVLGTVAYCHIVNLMIRSQVPILALNWNLFWEMLNWNLLIGNYKIKLYIEISMQSDVLFWETASPLESMQHRLNKGYWGYVVNLRIIGGGAVVWGTML